MIQIRSMLESYNLGTIDYQIVLKVLFKETTHRQTLVKFSNVRILISNDPLMCNQWQALIIT